MHVAPSRSQQGSHQCAGCWVWGFCEFGNNSTMGDEASHGFNMKPPFTHCQQQGQQARPPPSHQGFCQVPLPPPQLPTAALQPPWPPSLPAAAAAAAQTLYTWQMPLSERLSLKRSRPQQAALPVSRLHPPPWRPCPPPSAGAGPHDAASSPRTPAEKHQQQRVVWVAPLKRHDVPILPVLPFPAGEDCDSCKALPTHPPARPPTSLPLSHHTKRTGSSTPLHAAAAGGMNGVVGSSRGSRHRVDLLPGQLHRQESRVDVCAALAALTPRTF